MSIQSVQQCFLCNSETTYFSKSKNKFTWYNYKGHKICNLCYYKQYHKQVKQGTFQSYKQKIGLRICSRCGSDKTQITITRKGYPHRKWVSDGKGGYLCHNCTKRTLYREREGRDSVLRLLRQDPRFAWARMTLANHKRNGFVINISKKELTELASKTDKCVICDSPLTWGYMNGAKIRSRPSLDRTDNDIVVSYDTIQILCFRCNTMKGDRTMKEYVDYCTYVANKFKNQ